jgi:hypothetical protein
MKQQTLIFIFCVLLLCSCGDTPPEINITFPQEGALVNGIVEVSTEATGDVVQVDFFIDDTLMYTCRAFPFVFSWNTFVSIDSTVHTVCVRATDRTDNETYSDTVSVIVYNGPTLFADDFESYVPNIYPYAGWFEIWMGAGSSHSYVESGAAHAGTQSFRLHGTQDWVRTDGVEVPLTNIHELTFETCLMIPSGQSTGALFGFFMQINPTMGAICNGIWFREENNLVYARGIAEDSTGFSWQNDIWYSVKAVLNYDALLMDVWIDTQQIVFDLPAMPSGWADTFALATEHGAGGIVYYDDIMIYDSE